MAASTILAAGTVPWRATKSGAIKVLLIRRARHNDWSFPKGKVDPGEGLPHTAVRETWEETGLQVTLGVNLGMIHYTVGDNIRKTVQYWAAEVDRDTAKHYVFAENNEVKRVKWVALEEVSEKLTYPADRELFGVFKRLVAEHAHRTFPVIVLRHAKAAPRGPEFPVDHDRPLVPSGERKAEALVPVLAAFGPTRIISSPARRCHDTVKPLAEHLELRPVLDDAISQDTWDEGETQGLRERVAHVVDDAVPTVLCSHRPVMPDLTREIAAAVQCRPGRYMHEAAELPTGGFSVFHVAVDPAGPGIVAVEVYPIKR